MIFWAEIADAKFFSESVPSGAEKLISPRGVGTEFFAVAAAAPHFPGMILKAGKCGAGVLSAVAVGASGAFGGGNRVEKGFDSTLGPDAIESVILCGIW